MMKLVILPGNSKSNKEWSEKTAGTFSEFFPDQYIQAYSHWEEGKEIIDFDVESRKLEKNIGEGKFSIIAKSAGAMLTIYSVSKGLINPEKCVFLGLPVLWADEHNFNLRDWFLKFNIQTLVIQNSNDPLTSYSELKKFVDDASLHHTLTLIETEGNDHKYNEKEKIKKLVNNFLAAQP